jgi:flagellin-like protein
MTMKERKAISPVIATVILVAVAITVAVGVSYWMSGISSQYTSFEKVEIQSAYAIKETTPTAGWKITIKLKSSGTTDATLNDLFINDRPLNTTAACWSASDYATAPNFVSTSLPQLGYSIKSGETYTVTIWIRQGYVSLTSGTTVNIKLHSAGGMDYIKLVSLV